MQVQQTSCKETERETQTKRKFGQQTTTTKMKTQQRANKPAEPLATTKIDNKMQSLDQNDRCQTVQ